MVKFETFGKTIDEKIKEVRSQDFLKKNEEKKNNNKEDTDPIVPLIFALGEVVYEKEKDNLECPYYSFIKDINEKKEEIEMQKKNEKMNEEVDMCPKCGAPVGKTALFCAICGNKLEKVIEGDKVCLNCGTQVKETDKFCGSCGAPIE